MPRATSLPFLLLGLACAAPRGPAPDDRFAGVQARGAEVMGVDQYSSMHLFEDLPDGGRIVLVRRDSTDSAGVTIIRSHLRAIADSFGRGIFSSPARVHAMTVPGTTTMARLHERIGYVMRERSGGGEVRITTRDAEALAAVHEFLAFQRMDHHAGGHEGMGHSGVHEATGP